MRTSYLFKVEIVDIITHFAYEFWLIREIFRLSLNQIG
jgi:hypothetical protein